MAINEGDVTMCKNSLLVRIYQWGGGSVGHPCGMDDFFQYFLLGLVFILAYTIFVSILMCLALEFWVGTFWYDITDQVSVIFGVVAKQPAVFFLRGAGLVATGLLGFIWYASIVAWFRMSERTITFK